MTGDTEDGLVLQTSTPISHSRPIAGHHSYSTGEPTPPPGMGNSHPRALPTLKVLESEHHHLPTSVALTSAVGEQAYS